MDWRVFITTFGVIFLAEMGDKTQIATVALAARYGSLAAVSGTTKAGTTPMGLAIDPAGKFLAENDDIAVIEMANPQDDRACRQAQLRSAIIEIKQRDAGFRRQSYRGRAYMHFGARALISPKIVARSQRPVGHGGYPVAFSTRLKTD